MLKVNQKISGLGVKDLMNLDEKSQYETKTDDTDRVGNRRKTKNP